MNFDQFVDGCKRLIDDYPSMVDDWQGMTVFRPTGLGNPTMKHLPPESSYEIWDILAGAPFGGSMVRMAIDGLPGWMLTCVEPTQPVSVWVKHWNGRWEAIDPVEAPWLTLGTAGAMRHFLLTGQRTQVKRTTDPRLFGTVFETTPPVDERGRI